jgi:hypothetical protein
MRPFPALVFGTTVLVEIAAVGLLWRLEPAYDTILYALYSVAMVGAGALIASRHPDNAIGWLFCGFGLLNAVTADLSQGWGLRAADAGWPGGWVGEWVSVSSWLVQRLRLDPDLPALPGRSTAEPPLAPGSVVRCGRPCTQPGRMVPQP